MKLNKGNFIRAFDTKWRKMESKPSLPSVSSSPSADCDELLLCCPILHHLKKITSSDNIPKDVPRGHMVVYVGQGFKRHVVKISLLNHPLFIALLDQARDELGFTPSSKLWIPCEENMFLDVVRCAGSPRDRRIKLCL